MKKNYWYIIGAVVFGVLAVLSLISFITLLTKLCVGVPITIGVLGANAILFILSLPYSVYLAQLHFKKPDIITEIDNPKEQTYYQDNFHRGLCVNTEQKKNSSADKN